MPFIFSHVLMPDAHVGKGATVGSVIPTLGAIIPAAVGVDIGCGMMAIRTQYEVADIDVDLGELHAAISAAVPLSAGKYNEQITDTAKLRIGELESLPASSRPRGEVEFEAYMGALRWAQRFAFMNREEMMDASSSASHGSSARPSA